MEYILDLSLIDSLFKKQKRHFLNVKKNNNDIYILSYKKIDKTIERENKEYIKEILLWYVDYLNEKGNKKITLDWYNKYKKWDSFILDFINTNWAWYKAWDSILKNIIHKSNSNVFSFNEDFFYELINEESYYFIMFFLDKLELTFDFRKLSNYIKKLDLSNFINFALSSIDDMNKILVDKEIWTLKPKNEKAFLKFQKNILKLEIIPEEELNNWKQFLFDILISIHIESYNMSWNDEEIVYNRNQIIKYNKTNTKINNSFSNDIFHISLGKIINNF